MTSEKILIVDDTPPTFTCWPACSSRGATRSSPRRTPTRRCESQQRACPDLILLDVIMPGRDGFSVCRALKENDATRAIPVLFVTAKDETECLLRGFRCGAVDYISKPFQAEEVLVRVETHLQARAADARADRAKP